MAGLDFETLRLIALVGGGVAALVSVVTAIMSLRTAGAAEVEIKFPDGRRYRLQKGLSAYQLDSLWKEIVRTTEAPAMPATPPDYSAQRSPAAVVRTSVGV